MKDLLIHPVTDPDSIGKQIIETSCLRHSSGEGPDSLLYRVSNEKVNINEMNWTPNQYTEYPDLYIKTAKQAVPNP